MAAAVATCVTACKDDPIATPDNGNNIVDPNFISLFVGESGMGALSRTDSDADSLSCRGNFSEDSISTTAMHYMTLAGDTLCLMVEDRLNINANYDGAKQTPDSVASRGTIVPAGHIPSAHVVAIGQEGNKLIDREIHFNTPSNNAPVQLPERWPLTGDVSFMAYHGGDVLGANPHITNLNINRQGDDHTFTFSTNLRDNAGGYRDAEYTQDFVCASIPRRTPQDGPVPLRFHHAMTAITFVAGKMPADVSLQRIIIRGVYHAGSCRVVAAADGDVSFTWYDHYNIAETWQHVCDYDGDYQEWSGKDNVAEGSGLTSDALRRTFFMVPQNLPNDAVLVLNYRIAGREINLTKKLRDLMPSFPADHHITITIGVPDDISIKPHEDQVTNEYKTNVRMQNTGRTPGYIRAALVGAWVDMDKQVGFNWWSNSGSYEGIDSRWSRKADGFWYYSDIVMPGEYTAPMFTKYWAPEPPEAGYHLELDVIGQIVRYNCVSW